MFSFTIRGKVYQAATLAGISAAYCKARDESGEGASSFPFPDVDCDGERIGHISYNGRIWHRKAVGGRFATNTPLYCPAADPVPAMLDALRKLQALLDDWPTMRALSATGSAKATENKAKARDLIAAAIAAAESATN